MSAQARRTDPATSHAAAASITETQISDSQRAVLQTLRRIGPANDERLVALYAGPPQSPSGIRSRRKELVDLGLVVDTDERVKLASGRQSIVWAAASGRDARPEPEAAPASLFDAAASAGPGSAIFGT